MSKPVHLRRPKGKERSGSIVDKDQRSETNQARVRATLLERMRQRTDVQQAPEGGGPPR